MAAPGTSVFDALLTQCRDLVSVQLDKAIAGMLDKADGALAELANKTQDREAKKLYLEAQEAAHKQRAEMEKKLSPGATTCQLVGSWPASMRYVCGPAIPSGVSPRRLWYRPRATAVLAAKRPSIARALSP